MSFWAQADAYNEWAGWSCPLCMGFVVLFWLVWMGIGMWMDKNH